MTKLNSSTTARFLKSCLIFMLPAVIFCGCNQQQVVQSEKDAQLNFLMHGKIVVVDSCEYIAFTTSYGYWNITHKGNCKFCAERSKK